MSSYLIASPLAKRRESQCEKLIMKVACILAQEEKTHTAHGYFQSLWPLLGCLWCSYNSTANHRGSGGALAEAKNPHTSPCARAHRISSSHSSHYSERQRKWHRPLADCSSQTFGQAMIWTPKWGLDLRNSGGQLHCGKKKDAFTEKILLPKGDVFLGLLLT